MKQITVGRILILVVFALLLVACSRERSGSPSQAPSVQEPTTQEPAVQEPAPTDTPAPDEAEGPETSDSPTGTPVSEAQTGPGEQSLPPEAKGGEFPVEFSSPDGGFTLPLPEGWEVLGSAESPLGVQLFVGPSSLSPEDPGVSTIIYGDAGQVTVESAVEQLCAGTCEPLPQMEPTTLGAQPAQRVTIPGNPPQEWFFVENGDVLVIFSIRDPETQETRSDIVQAMRFSPVFSQAAQSEEIGMVVRQTVAQERQLSPEQVTVKSVEAAEWSNACLDAPGPDEMCAEVITPGFRVIVEANGEELEYHTDSSGQQIRLAEAP